MLTFLRGKRYQLGDWLPLGIVTRNANGVPSLADNPVTAKIFDATGTLVVSVELPHSPERELLVDEVFYGEARLRLGSDFSTGKYMIVYSYTTNSGSNVRKECDGFEIVGGGSTAGAIIGEYYFEVPNARAVAYQLDNGDLIRQINPR